MELRANGVLLASWAPDAANEGLDRMGMIALGGLHRCQRYTEADFRPVTIGSIRLDAP